MTFTFLQLLCIMLVGASAGLLGALTGLGGGIIVIPCLTLLFHIPLHQAMAAGLIATLTTSSGAAAALLKEGFTNLRIGMLLEVGTMCGALAGAVLVPYVPLRFLELLFGVTLLLSAATSAKRQEHGEVLKPSDPLAVRLQLPGTYATKQGEKSYVVCRVKLGMFIMMIAGLLSGLLGIGSGAVKVLAMDQVMRLPYKVATATSNFIIGITATAGIGIYWKHGYVQDTLCVPVMLGVLAGALWGGRLLAVLNAQRLRYLFVAVITIIGVQMIYRGCCGL